VLLFVVVCVFFDACMPRVADSRSLLQFTEQHIELLPVALCHGELAVLAREDVLNYVSWIFLTRRGKLTSSKSSYLSRQFSQ
jgi:hypothetical protein